MNAAKPLQDNIFSVSGPARSGAVYRPTWAEIDLSAFRRNFRTIKKHLKKNTNILAVVKANAYGHCSVPLSKEAFRLGAAMLGVSSLEEGIHLRENGIKGPVLILGSIYPLENLRIASRYNLIPTISSVHGLSELARAARREGKILPFHLKVDTGMGRIGLSPESALKLLYRIIARREIKMAGMYTHFSCADSDRNFTLKQLARFKEVITRARSMGMKFTAHAANSAALFRYPQARLDMVRPGISLYGLSPYGMEAKIAGLSPVLSWKTRIVYLKRVRKNTPVSYGKTFTSKRPVTVATLPVGYADGYDRGLSNRGEVLVRSVKCPVIGRVTMDMIMIDVSNVPSVEIGDEAVLIGRQNSRQLSAEEMAGRLDTINYEVTCGISCRVPRILIKG